MSQLSAPQVGDHVATVWGYDETRVSFYEVVGVTPSGKSVRLQRTANKVVSSWGSQESVVPGEKLAGEKVQLVRVKPGYFNVSKYQYGTLWAGQPLTQDGPGWGR